MTQFTASEMRAEAHRHANEVEDMLNAAADLLEAREKAVPVATVKDQFGFPIPKWIGDAGDKCPVGTKLYTHPDPSDAERLVVPYGYVSGSPIRENAGSLIVSIPEADFKTPVYTHPAPSDAERLAEPVGYVTIDGLAVWYKDGSFSSRPKPGAELYTHPAPSDSKRLAEALRDCIRDLRIAVEYGKTMRNPNALLETVAKAEQALAAHSAQAQPPDAVDPMVGYRHDEPERYGYAQGWNACRAAMLAAQENPNG